MIAMVQLWWFDDKEHFCATRSRESRSFYWLLPIKFKETTNITNKMCLK